MSTLSESQQAAVAQLRDLTNGGEDDVAIGILESVDWDVQRAAELVFGAGAPPPRPAPPPPPLPPIEQFDIDDSEQYQPIAPRNPPGFSLSSIWTFPFQLLGTLLRFIFGVLRIPLPRPFAFNLALFRPRHARSPPRSDGGADRWVRELEEETGALCMSSAQHASGVDVGTSSAGAAGPSTLTHRGPSDRKVLPDFTLGTYEDALRTCQRDARIACIVLVSEEHDDVPEFKRTTLTDPTLVQLLHTNDILVWGGDVRDREAYSASLKLQATTFPFVAFVALQPKRTPRSSSSSSTPPPSTLTVLSRHQGPPSGTGPTSPTALSTHLEIQLLPRVTPFLAQLRAAAQAAAAERALRAEQDAAFHATAARDVARIQARMDAEARERRAAEEAREAAEIAAAQAASAREETERRAGERARWRRWARKALAGVPEDQNGVKLAIRLPDGGRVVRRFADGCSLTALYAFVDAQLVDGAAGEERSPKGHTPSQLEAAMEGQIADAGGANAWWGFQLVLAYPRRDVPWVRSTTVGDVESLKGGAQLVVHLLTPTQGTADDDDGYISEE
ncbi:UBX domain-containing protein [Mycena sanguinolenta]|uniref:UBX domain-containing protein n=1 Tax=Mycena sanguinolenta TaxID=230812 RepID=A0A8H6ZHQ0_9AGAR|nr:UBX domain-containing protein [Mycena sanguinolenta]